MDEGNSTYESSGSFPRVRMWLCGSFSMEWIDPETGKVFSCSENELRRKDAAKDVAQAVSLVKLLLCQPGRQAHRDWIMEQFWPESVRNAATHRLENIASTCRKVFRPLGDEPFLRSMSGKKNSGSSYALPAYPHLWVDIDALAWNVEQAARMERFGDDALPFWQRAFELLKRGLFLEDELYADWVKDRRAQIEGHTRQCVHALSHLYLTRYGEAGKSEALLLLRTYWLQHKTDEDALRPLLELLGEQERYQEAEEYYQQLLYALAEEGPNEDGQPQKPDARTRDIREYLSYKQLQRKCATNKPIHLPLSAPPSTTSLFLSCSPVSLMLGESAKSTHDVSLDIVKSRRQLLHDLLSAACTVLVLSPYALESRERHRQGFIFLSKGDGLDFTVLDDLEHITASYWRLCKNVSLDLLGSVTEHFQTVTFQLKRKQTPKIAQHLCQLAGETAQILGKTLFDLHEYALAWSYYTFSIKAAQVASNHDLWAVGLGRMSLLLLYWKQPQDACSLVHEAQQLTIQCPRIACWLAAVEAEVYAQLGDADACDQALQVAKQLAASEPLGEDRYATGMNSSRLAGYEGACFVRLRYPERALTALQQAASLLDPLAIRRQSTILSDIGRAYAQQGNIQEACKFAKHALALTMQTRSMSVLERVCLVRQELEPWKETESVQELEKHLAETSALITV